MVMVSRLEQMPKSDESYSDSSVRGNNPWLLAKQRPSPTNEANCSGKFAVLSFGTAAELESIQSFL